VYPRRLQLVLGHHLGPQRQDLEGEGRLSRTSRGRLNAKGRHSFQTDSDIVSTRECGFYTTNVRLISDQTAMWPPITWKDDTAKKLHLNGWDLRLVGVDSLSLPCETTAFHSEYF